MIQKMSSGTQIHGLPVRSAAYSPGRLSPSFRSPGRNRAAFAAFPARNTSIASRNVRAASLDIDGVERLAASHEQAVSLRPPEADVAADFRKQDLPDARSVRREDMDPVVSRADP